MIAYNNIFPTKCAITLTCGSLELTDDELNDFRCYRSLCSSSVLAYGSCESDYIVFSCEPQTENLVGKEFTLTLTPEGQSAILMGSYKVTECTKDASNAEWTCKAYDKMYEILNTDVSSWLSGLTYPITLADYKASLATFLGVSVTPRSALPNDSFVITKAQISGTMSAGYVLRNICELNACFGHIGRQGWLSYVTLGTSSVLDVDNDTYYDFEAAEANTTAISKVIVRENSGDAGAVSGTGDEIYTITGNYLIYGTDAATRQTVADNIYNAIKNVTYRPAEMEMYLDPRLELGDMITAEDMDENVHTTYVLMHDYEGIVFQDSTISARGDEHRVVEVNSVYSQVEQLASRTARLDVSVEGIEAEVSEKVDIEGGTSTTSASWSLKPEAFTVSSNGTQVLKVDSNGLEVNGKGTFSGTVQASSIIAPNILNADGYDSLTASKYIAVNDTDGILVVGYNNGCAVQLDGKKFKVGTPRITGTTIYPHGTYRKGYLDTTNFEIDSMGFVTCNGVTAAGFIEGGTALSNKYQAKGDYQPAGNYLETTGGTIHGQTSINEAETDGNTAIGNGANGLLYLTGKKVLMGSYGTSPEEIAIGGSTTNVNLAGTVKANNIPIANKDDIASIKYLGWDVPTEYTGTKNYVDSNGLFHQKVGRVDLGSLSWSYNSECFYTDNMAIPNSKYDYYISGYPSNKLYCSKYTPSEYPMTDKCIALNPHNSYGNRAVVKDTSYTDAVSFRNSLNGTYLYYELASEVTYSDGSELMVNSFVRNSFSAVTDANGFAYTTISALTSAIISVVLWQPTSGFAIPYRSANGYTIKVMSWDMQPIANTNVGFDVVFKRYI